MQGNIFYQSEVIYLFDLTSVVIATIDDIQKKTDAKFKTLKLLEKHDARIYKQNKGS